jgi:hypothetical protein
MDADLTGRRLTILVDGICLACAVSLWALIAAITIGVCIAAGPIRGLFNGMRCSRQIWRVLVIPPHKAS